MDYEVIFADSFAEDLAFLALYEVQFVFSIDAAYLQLESVVDELERALSAFPERNAERAYGFTSTRRRKYVCGKYTAFYWIDKKNGVVTVDRLVHSKSDFGRIHFGN